MFGAGKGLVVEIILTFFLVWAVAKRASGLALFVAADGCPTVPPG